MLPAAGDDSGEEVQDEKKEASTLRLVLILGGLWVTTYINLLGGV